MSEYGIFESLINEGKLSDFARAIKQNNEIVKPYKDRYKADVSNLKDNFKKSDKELADKEKAAKKEYKSNPSTDAKYDYISAANERRKNKSEYRKDKDMMKAEFRNKRGKYTIEAGIFSDILETQNTGNVAGGSTQNGADAPTDPGNDPADAKTSATATQENSIFSKFI